VNGTMTQFEALSRLLASSHLDVNAISAGVFALRAKDMGQNSAYFGLLSEAIFKGLCAERLTSDVRARVSLQLWIEREGRVSKLKFLSSSGSNARKKELRNTLLAMRAPNPPRDLPQPVTIILRARTPTMASCKDYPR